MRREGREGLVLVESARKARAERTPASCSGAALVHWCQAPQLQHAGAAQHGRMETAPGAPLAAAQGRFERAAGRLAQGCCADVFVCARARARIHGRT